MYGIVEDILWKTLDPEEAAAGVKTLCSIFLTNMQIYIKLLQISKECIPFFSDYFLLKANNECF